MVLKGLAACAMPIVSHIKDYYNKLFNAVKIFYK